MKKVVFLLCYVLASNVWSAGVVTDTTVTMVDGRVDDVAFISFGRPIQNYACPNTNDQRFIINTNTSSGKALLSIATAALVSGKSVNAQGTGGCNSRYPSFEGLMLLQMK